MGQIMTRVTKRSGAALATLMVASLLALAPGPAVAVDGQADNSAAYTACPGEATASAGFVDTVGHYAEEEIDCLAYYRITVGTLPDRFSPNQPILRWQMALFLVRAAGPAGISLPGVSDQGFTDLEGKAPYIRDAINQVAALGITRGTSPTTFSPDVRMDRRQMALFLYRFLGKSPKGPGGAEAARIVPDDTVFEDLGSLSEAAVTAIGVMYEMGVTTGTTSTTFAPRNLVTRAQMALFITRALAHTNSRPAGVTIQSDSAVVSAGDTLDVHISIRDRQFRPQAGGLVDVFSTPADDPYSSFGTDGACLQAVEAAFGGRVCMIDRSDRRLDEKGNLLVVLEPADNALMWAWAGSLNNEFEVNTTTFGSIEIEVIKPAATLRVRDDMRHTARALKLGDTLELVFQLVDDDGRPVNESHVPVQLTTTYEHNGVTDRTNIKTHRTNGQGRVTVTFRGTDPDESSSTDSVTLDLDVAVRALEVLDQTTLGVVADDGNALITWSEEAPVASTLRLRQTVAYHELRESGPGLIHLVRAVLTDQYGDPVPDAVIDFSSDDPAGVGTGPVRKNTSSSGVGDLALPAGRFDGLLGTHLRRDRRWQCGRPAHPTLLDGHPGRRPLGPGGSHPVGRCPQQRDRVRRLVPQADPLRRQRPFRHPRHRSRDARLRGSPLLRRLQAPQLQPLLHRPRRHQLLRTDQHQNFRRSLSRRPQGKTRQAEGASWGTVLPASNSVDRGGSLAEDQGGLGRVGISQGWYETTDRRVVASARVSRDGPAAVGHRLMRRAGQHVVRVTVGTAGTVRPANLHDPRSGSVVIGKHAHHVNE